MLNTLTKRTLLDLRAPPGIGASSSSTEEWHMLHKANTIQAQYVKKILKQLNSLETPTLHVLVQATDQRNCDPVKTPCWLKLGQNDHKQSLDRDDIAVSLW